MKLMTRVAGMICRGLLRVTLIAFENALKIIVGLGLMLARLVVGTLIIASIGCMFAGVQGFLQFLVLSIVCTAGLSLLVWFPAIYLVGWLFVALLQPAHWRITSMDSSPKGGPFRAAPGRNRTKQALDNYIAQARSWNLNDEQIRCYLKTASWTDAEIEGAMHSAGGP